METKEDIFIKIDLFEQITIEAIWQELVQECNNINNTGNTNIIDNETSVTLN